MMVSLTVILGGVLIGSSWILRSRYIAYNRDRQIFDLILETQRLFEAEKRALDSYMIGTETAKDQYLSLELEMGRILSRWRGIANYAVEKKEQRDIETRITALRSSLNQVFQMVEKNRRIDAVQVMESALLPAIDAIQARLKTVAAQTKQQSDQSWQSAQNLAGSTTLFSLILLAAVILSGAGFSIVLYQSISRPLAQLQEGTQKIAQGQWDLKLELIEPVELADLARSFEEMSASLKKLQAQVLQMDRMSAVGTLAGGVAHEINNPLTGVLGQAQLLLEKLPPNDPSRANVEKIEHAAQRCKKIVRGLLDFSRPTEYSFEPVDTNSLVSATLSLCESEMAALGIKLVWQKHLSLPKMWASANHLQQVFLNILTNAIDAMPGGGSLTITTHIDRVDSDLFPAQTEGPVQFWEFIEISFKDTGSGIQEKQLAHIFDPFFTTKEVGKGTGLGLSISFGIVQQHSGEITVTSDGPGHGAKFTVRIPTATHFLEKESDKTERNLAGAEKKIERFPAGTSASGSAARA